MNMVVLIDNGHGFDTPGKCSPDGKYQEWAWAREMAGLIVHELKTRGIDALLLVPERQDIPLDRGTDNRVKRVNEICTAYGAANVVVVSIHSNAGSSDGKWHDGKWSGFVAEVSQNASENSKRLADFIWARAIEAGLKGNRSFTDKPGKRYLVQSLAICRETRCPAVLTESAFHDTHEGVKILTERKTSIALVHADGIMDYLNFLNNGKK